ncbi:hypothetical protein B0H11DRAFT_2194443 [Mycena galericulata]|nr:hypothetical protein B0H11DRAFT_2194443 [Mycena galericulata]
MPRKAAAGTDGAALGEPRRSTRIKELPKAAAPVKIGVKPRGKESKESNEEKHKRGRKRKERADAYASAADDEVPPAKKQKLASKAAQEEDQPKRGRKRKELADTEANGDEAESAANDEAPPAKKLGPTPGKLAFRTAKEEGDKPKRGRKRKEPADAEANGDEAELAADDQLDGMIRAEQ